MRFVTSMFFSLASLSLLSLGCVKHNEKQGVLPERKSTLVMASKTDVNQIIRDNANSIQIISPSVFKTKELNGEIQSIKGPRAVEFIKQLPQAPSTRFKSRHTPKPPANPGGENSLLVGLPLGLIGQESLFGGVITKVSDTKDENLGDLKLTDLTPIHVRSTVVSYGESYALALIGCPSECDEYSTQEHVISLPIVGVDEVQKTIILDLTSIGQSLDLITLLDPNGIVTNLRAFSSSVLAVDFSVSTLVFDIKTSLVPLKHKSEVAPSKITEFVVRWYLKLNSGSNSAFISRRTTPEVGFFTTERAKESKITRFSTTNFGRPIKYYIKNVPSEWKGAFSKAFDSWNKVFSEMIKRDLFSIEFIDANDPRAEELVTGDIRYNIIEWDLVNLASYGGLGPSVANQNTGEILSGNILIQGPSIIEIYSKWFETSKRIRELKTQGELYAANRLKAEFIRETKSKIEHQSRKQYQVHMAGLAMNIHSQRAELEDPLLKENFEIVPEGLSFETYMNGYLQEMLEHELGHNLGLRHNFKGSLGATDTGEQGSVSRSVMDYLGRSFRHLNAVGDYDKMAMAYGYKGTTPLEKNWFCSDGQSPEEDPLSMKIKNPECSKVDATSDPFSYFEKRLERVIELLVETKTSGAPLWRASEMEAQLSSTVIGLLSYATSAEFTMSKWVNFHLKEDRPKTHEGVVKYVLGSIKNKLCSPDLETIINAKESDSARELAQQNLSTVIRLVEFMSKQTLIMPGAKKLCEEF
jgi:hypothetical protein